MHVLNASQSALGEGCIIESHRSVVQHSILHSHFPLEEKGKTCMHTHIIHSTSQHLQVCYSGITNEFYKCVLNLSMSLTFVAQEQLQYYMRSVLKINKLLSFIAIITMSHRCI